MMKKITTLLLTFLAFAGYSQAQTDVLSAAQKLVDAKKYESAYVLLDNDDPDNEKPDVVLMKEDIVLNYFVSSMMHQVFALKDLKKNEDVMDYRGKTGTFSLFPFQVDSVLLKLIAAYPDNCKLYRGLAFYYNEVLNKYAPDYTPEFLALSQEYLADKYMEDTDRWGEMKQGVWDGYTDFMVEAGLLEAPIDASELFTNDFLPEAE